ncbi:MAG: hypothetical protein JRN32_03450 [Nitrososphaerota archaeon]|jgi:hypothetical protein|nr:hypothetical protein [Nitrososphaerota archaeon]
MSQYKVPIYFDNEYYDSIEYKEAISADDRTQIIEDAIEMMEGEMYKEIDIGADKSGNIAVFAKSE